MTDLRHGVTEVQHTVLDMLNPDGPNPLVRHGYDTQLYLAHCKTRNAQAVVGLKAKRDFAIDAAARLIAVAEDIDAMIAAGDA